MADALRQLTYKMAKTWF